MITQPPEDRLDAAIPELMTRAHVPGLAAALVRGADIAWSRSFGLKRAGRLEPVASDTVFQAASLSKPVFAYAVLKLVERGVLDLDAPLTAPLPERYVSDDALLDQITARRVLSHTTGWPNWRPEDQPLRRERAPGERFGYSGEGYVYLQRVIEHITEASLDVFMQRELLDPLEMTHSSYRWAPPDDPAVATSHDRTGEPCPPATDTWTSAASSLHTTANDFARFLTAMLTSGDEPWRLSDETVAEMLRPQVSLTDTVAWGLGWGLEIADQGRAFWHWGDNPGYNSLVLAFPDIGLGLVVMTNSAGGVALWEPIARLVFGGDHPAFAWLATFYGVPSLNTLVEHSDET